MARLHEAIPVRSLDEIPIESSSLLPSPSGVKGWGEIFAETSGPARSRVNATVASLAALPATSRPVSR
jgi:hypothetical protein